MLSGKLIEWNESLSKYHFSLDGNLAFGTMFIMVYFDVKSFYIVLTGVLIHGIMHPLIVVPR
jgi:hypothetical protein